MSDDSMRSRLDRVIGNRPVDALAARVTRKGINFEPNTTIAADVYHGSVPPPPAPTPRLPNWEDLRQQRVGRLVVIGWLGKPKGKKGKWSVRCDCGAYEIRTTPALRNPDNADDRCYECRYIERVKAGKGNNLPKVEL